MSTIKKLLDALDGVKKTSSGWQARCPAHEDKNASLSASEGDDGKLLVHCHAGCTVESIAGAIGWKVSDLFTEPKQPKQIVAEYDYPDEHGAVLYQSVRLEPKSFFQRHKNGTGEWANNMTDVRRVLYQLPKVIEAVKAGETVYVCEGEKDVAALVERGFVATTNVGGAGKWRRDYTETLRGAKRVVIIADKDTPGRKHAREVAAALSGAVGFVGVIELPNRAGTTVKDTHDYFSAGASAADFLVEANSATPFVQEDGKSLALDESKAQPPTKQPQGGATKMEPWPDAVNGVELLDALANEYKKFLVLPEHAAVILALYTLHTYSWEQCEYSPIIAITSPVRACGKSRVLDVMEKFVHAAFRTGNLSEAVLFRVLDSRKPSILIDELDTIPDERRGPLANILKNGFHRSGRVHRVEGESKREIVEFNVFGPKVVACIKLSTLDGATVSRCINIRMQRKKKSQKVLRLRHYTGNEFQRKCLRWTSDNLGHIDATADMPDALSDRAQDIQEPLFILANIAGGDWPDRIKNAALALCGESDDAPQDSAISLLVWIRNFFTESGADKASSSALVRWLNDKPDAPFSSWNDGKGISQSNLRRQLAGFEIHPDVVRLDATTTARGYALTWFEEAFSAYIEENRYEKCNNVTDPVNIDDSATLPSVTAEPCYSAENSVSPNKDSQCYSVTVPDHQTVPPKVVWPADELPRATFRPDEPDEPEPAETYV